MKHEKGFSLVEIMIAIVIVATGLLALSAALVIGVTLPGRARQQEIAKQLAGAIMESIIAAKESSRPGFSGLDSLNFQPNGRFVKGVAPMLEAGPDGVYGTCDDGQPPGTFNPTCTSFGTRIMQIDVDPGSNGIYNDQAAGRTADNRPLRLFNFTREVQIDDIPPPPNGIGPGKQITVIVNYGTPTGSRDKVVLVCQLTNFRKL